MEVKEDKLFRIFLYGGGVILALLIFLIILSLVSGSYPSIKVLGIKFIFNTTWDPVNDEYGLLPFFVGTILTSVLALVISLPFALSIAIFLSVYFKDGFIHKVLSYASDLLAGIPSVIYGFWGLFFLVPLMRRIEMKLGVVPYGVGILTASILLAIMIIPYASSIAREVIRMVPQDLVEAGYALGGTTYEVVRSVIIPYVRSGIFAGILLAFGRAFGETMAVTMVIGNANVLPKSIFAPANTMASVIANEFTEATKTLHLSSLIYIGLWLFIIITIINYLGNIVIEKTKPFGSEGKP